MAEEEYTDEQIDAMEDEKEDLPFAKAEVVRLMKENLDDDKMIRERVKVEMNKFLGDVLKNVCQQLNEYPYTTIEYEMLKESIYPYTNIKRINQEKERILLHLEAIFIFLFFESIFLITIKLFLVNLFLFFYFLNLFF